MKRINLKFITESAIIIALYVVVTYIFAPMSYEGIQFRISEILVLLIFFNKKFYFPLVLATFISNIPSALGWYDMVFGTLATALALIPMLFVKKIYIGAIFPVISNMFIVPIELGLAFELWAPEMFWLNVLTVGLGEAVVLFLLGIPFIFSINKNEALMTKLKFNHLEIKYHIAYGTTYILFSSFIGILFIVSFFAYPMIQTKINDEDVYASPLSFVISKNYYFLITIIVFSLIYIIKSFIFKNEYLRLIFTFIFIIGILTNTIFLGIYESNIYINPYFYAIYLLLFISILPDILAIRKKKKNQMYNFE